MGKWMDITQTLHNGIAVWPGDTPFHFELACTKEQTSSVNIGQVTMSTHTGTHIDAPFHFDNDGKKVHEMPVELYIGKARVVDVSGYDIITKEVIGDVTGVTRLLLKTNAHTNQDVFPMTFPSIHREAAIHLQTCGVRLLGVDVPSVDDQHSKELAAHHSLQQNGIAILENIVLTDVESGEYELICLPLKLHGADGSPVRAVIRKCEER